jgi:hypothetical protein
MFTKFVATTDPERAAALALLLLALDDQLTPTQRDLLAMRLPDESALAAEVGHVRAQLCALANYADRVD